MIVNENTYTTEVLKETVADSYNRLIAPAIEREIRSELTERAENGAIEVFGKKSAPASDAATDRRKSGTWMGSRIPYRM